MSTTRNEAALRLAPASLILVDQDGVLADFERGFFEAWSAQAPDFPAVPIEARRAFRLRDQYPAELRPRVEAIYHARGFYRDLPPVPGAIDGIEALLARGHDVRICTSPLSDHTHCVPEKYAWVDRHLGRAFTKRMIVTKDKTLVVGDILVDDNPAVRGARTPGWLHWIYDQPYNRHASGPRVTWASLRVLADGSPTSPPSL